MCGEIKDVFVLTGDSFTQNTEKSLTYPEVRFFFGIVPTKLRVLDIRQEEVLFV